MTRQNIIALALAVCALGVPAVCMEPAGMAVCAAAYTGTCGEQLTWVFDADTGTLTVSGTGDMTDYSLKEGDAKPPWSDREKAIKRVVIQEGVTSIGSIAFEMCENLTSVQLPGSLQRIGKYAFILTGLTEVDLPEGLTSIGSYAFASCKALRVEKLPDSLEEIEEAAFFDCGCTFTELPPGVKTVEVRAFDSSKIPAMTVPMSVERIEKGAFSNCKELQAFRILNPACEIYDDAWAISETAAIYGYAGSTAEAYAKEFDYKFVPLDGEPVETPVIAQGTCGEHLTWLLSEDGTLTISGTGEMDNWNYGERAPWDEHSDAIKKVVIEEGVTSIGEFAFYCYPELTSVQLPESLTTVGEFAFSGCTELPEIMLPESITTVGDCAFRGCEKLATIHFPESLTDIGGSAFLGTAWMDAQQAKDPIVVINGILVDGLTFTGDLVIPDTVTSIADNAFYAYMQGMTSENLTSVVIPASVTKIGNAAFVGCAALTDVTILNPDCVIPFNEEAGEGTIHGYTGSTAEDYAKKVNCQFVGLDTAFPEVDHGTCGENAAWALSEDGTLTISGTGAMEEYYFGGYRSWPWPEELVKKLVIGEGITGIGAFSKHPNLTSIELPESLETIIGRAFNSCNSLTTVTIPAGVQEIDLYAFANCKNLKSITILNPECEIADDQETISNEWVVTVDDDGQENGGARYYGTIYGHPGSTAQAYAERYGYQFAEVGTEPAALTGDVNGDVLINASDAAIVLMAAATEGTTGTSPLTPAQVKAADVNQDKTVNASDAALILMYSAAVGTGFDGTIGDYIAR